MKIVVNDTNRDEFFFFQERYSHPQGRGVTITTACGDHIEIDASRYDDGLRGHVTFGSFRTKSSTTLTSKAAAHCVLEELARAIALAWP